MARGRSREVAIRDVVLIGGSAGSVGCACGIVAGLPAGFGASLVVAVHTQPDRAGRLAEVLARSGALAASEAAEGMVVQHGHIYVAAPGRHLRILPDGRMALPPTGPKDHARPSINLLFASAAEAWGPRIVAVILSGLLDDGAAGMAAVHAAGGVCVVQDPADAEFPAMPRAVLDAFAPDHCVPARRIAGLLVELTGAGRADHA